MRVRPLSCRWRSSSGSAHISTNGASSGLRCRSEQGNTRCPSGPARRLVADARAYDDAARADRMPASDLGDGPKPDLVLEDARVERREDGSFDLILTTTD